MMAGGGGDVCVRSERGELEGEREVYVSCEDRNRNSIYNWWKINIFVRRVRQQHWPHNFHHPFCQVTSKRYLVVLPFAYFFLPLARFFLFALHRRYLHSLIFSPQFIYTSAGGKRNYKYKTKIETYTQRRNVKAFVSLVYLLNADISNTDIVLDNDAAYTYTHTHRYTHRFRYTYGMALRQRWRRRRSSIVKHARRCSNLIFLF